MTQNKKSPALQRLTLPAAAVQRLRKAGIFCNPGITIEFQQSTKRHVLRGRESGGAVKEFGHYVTFCGDGGERLPWFVRPDSLTANGDHAIVIAPALVSIEAVRVEHTYELLIARHELRAEKQGQRPRISSRVVFRGWQGQLPLDLVEKDRSIAGKIAPEFFTRAGEPRQLPAQFVDGIHAVTAAVSCRQCSHSHFLVEPRRQRQDNEQGDQVEGSTDKDQETTAAAIG